MSSKIKQTLLYALLGGGLLTYSLAETNSTSQIKTYELGAVEVSATYEADFNPSISIIGVKDIKDKNAQNVAGAIRMTSGVMMNEATGSG